MARALLVVTMLASGCDLFFPLNDPNVVPADAGGDAAVDSLDGRSPGKRVFITAALFRGNLGGVPGANAKCEAEAAKGQLGGNYFAWISTLASPAGARLPPAGAEPYTLVGGATIADNMLDLTDGSIDHPIDLTQHGADPMIGGMACNGTGVWSNTSALGSVVNGGDCNQWTSADVNDLGNAGTHAAMDGTWSNDPGCTGIPCDQQLSLYCIER